MASSTECLRAQIADVRTLAALLRPIAFSGFATVSLSESGLTFTTEQDRSLQANAYVPANLFSTFEFRPAQLVLSASRKRKRGPLSASRQSSSALAASGSARGSELNEPGPLSPGALEEAEREASERVRGAHRPSEPAAEDEEEVDERGESSSLQTVDFDVSLSNLLQCLNIFGGAPALNKALHAERESGTSGRDRDKEPNEARTDAYRTSSRLAQGSKARSGKGGEVGVTSAAVSYDAVSKRLILILDDEGGATTRCELTTYEPQGITDLAFDPDYLVAQAIMRSELVADAMSSVDPSATFIGLRFSPQYKPTVSETAQAIRSATCVSAGMRPSLSSSVVMSSSDGLSKHRGGDEVPTIQVLKLTADSDTGTVEMELPNERGVMERFVCNYDFEQRYNYKHMSTTTRALQTSIKTSLRIDERGLLSMQCLMPAGLGRVANEGDSTKAPGRGSNGTTLLNSHGFIEFTVLPLDEESVRY